MKMSDALELPVVQNQSRLFKHVVYSEKSDVVVFSCHNDQIAQHACHAINNHDRLAEENAKLREVLEKLVNTQHETGGSLGLDGQFYYKTPEGIFKSAEQLLNQLKDGSQ